MILEIACFDPHSALLAAEAGAKRLELCKEYAFGGLTPEKNSFLFVREKTNIPIFVMIRPREGNFCYSDAEFEDMKEQIQFFKEQQCDGFVFGILNEDNSINTAQCKQLIELAAPLPCTFNRAFDEVPDAFVALEQIIACGFARILTSGKANTAIEGKELIVRLIEKAANKIIIVPGGSIRSSNLKTLLETCRTNEFHSAAISRNHIFDINEIKELLNILNVN